MSGFALWQDKSMKTPKAIPLVILALITSLLSFVVTPAHAVLPTTVACSGGGTFSITGTTVDSASGDCRGSLVIPEGITSIGSAVFWTSHVSGPITSVSLPSTLATINDYAFFNQPITAVTIPASVTYIGTIAFGNAALANVTFIGGSSSLTIANNAFQNASFTSISFPSNLTTLATGAILGASALQSIYFQGNAPDISGGTFNTLGSPKVFITATATGFTKPTWGGLPVYTPPTFTLSSNFETATAGVALSGYTITSTGDAITSYSISPAIGNGLSFNTSTGLITGTPTAAASTVIYTITAHNATSPDTSQTYAITVNPGAPAFTLSSPSETATAGSPITGYTISSTGGPIASYAISPAIGNGLSFSTSTGRITGTPTTAASAVIYTITAHNATAPDATRTFTLTVNTQPPGCSGGGTLTIVNNVVTGNIGCTGSVVVPSGVTAIGSYAFQRSGIVSVVLPNGLTTIGNGAFYSSVNLASVSLPSTLKTIGDNAFRYTALTSVTIPASVTYIGYLTFSIPKNTLNKVTFLGGSSDEPLTIGSGAFQYSPLSGITLPSNLRTLDPGAFDATNRLQCINFAGNAPTVSAAFSGLGSNAPLPSVYTAPGVTGFTSTWKGLSVSTGLTGCITYAPGIGGSGAGPTSPTKVSFGSTFTTPVNAFTALAGYTFTGWSDGTNTYSVNATYPATGTVSGNVELTALWNRTSYTVTFHANGGVGSDVTQTSSAPANLVSNSFTRTSYSFLGWNTNADGSGTQVSDGFASYPFVANVDLYAQWGGVITYTNTSATSGSPSRTSDNWTSGVINLPSVGTMVKAGYTFGGWAISSGSSTPVAIPYTPAGTTTLYPIWVANSYTISFNGNGANSGAVPANQSWSTGSSATSLSGNTGTLTKTGFAFGGWATTASSTTVVPSYGTARNQSFYAIWTPITYTFNYALNGGTLTPAPTQAPRNIYQTFVTPNTVPANSTSVFGGWNTAADGSGLSFGKNQTFTVNSTTATSTTLTAQWIPLYTVHFVGNGSLTTLPADTLYASGQSLTLPGAPALAGYDFAGWRDSANVLHQASTLFAVLENSVLTAEWTPKAYSITYDMNSGTSTTPLQSSLHYLDTFRVALTPTRAGYTFDYWSDGLTNYAAEQLYVVGTSNITLTAHWTAISYNITYDFGGGQGTVPAPATAIIGTTFNITNTTPTLTGYTFSAWFDGTRRYLGSASYAVSSSDVVLTALFTQNGYTSITYLPNGGSGVAPNQDGLLEGSRFLLSDGTALTKIGSTFSGWSDGIRTYQPGESYYVGSYASPISLTAQWTPVYVVTYSQGAGAGTPPTDATSYFLGDTFIVADSTGLSKSGYTFTLWNDGVNTYLPGAVYTVGSTDIVLTAQWSQDSSSSAPDPVQQSKIVSIAPASASAGTQNPIVISGTFVEKISNVQINGTALPAGSWTQTPTSVSFTLPMTAAGSYQVQLYNGAAPVLLVQTVVLSPAAPTPLPSPSVKPTPTPTPTPTATPTVKPTPTATFVPNLQPTAEMKKIATFDFALDSYFLDDASKMGLRAVAAKLKNSSVTTILLYGHTDATKGVNNSWLSKMRASAVRDFLKPLLPGKKLVISWFADAKPLVSGTSAAANAKNRRVEIWVK